MDMKDFEFNVEIVGNYEDSNDTWLFISCGNGSSAKYKVNSLEDVKAKLAFYIDNYVEPYVI